MEINAIQKFHSTPLTPEQYQKRKENTEQAATVIGGTGFAASATRYAGKKGLMKSAETGEKLAKTVLESTSKAAKIVSNNSKEASGLFGNFKKNVVNFTGDVLAKFTKFKDNKFIGPIVKSPLMKKAAGAFGVIMAFFVLVTGVRKAVESGSIAIDDIKNKTDELANKKTQAAA